MPKLKKLSPIDEDVYIFRSVTRSGRQKIRKIRAPSFELAKEKAILQFSQVIYFKPKPMDLLTAIERAKKASKDAKKPYYIILEGDGECSIGTAPLRGATHKYVLGVEDKNFYELHGKAAEGEVKEMKPKKSLPAQSEKAEKLIKSKAAKESAVEDSKNNSNNKKQNKMEKVAKKAAKKSAKKAAGKKETPAKKGKMDLFKIGKKVTMTNKEMTAKIKKGYKYYNAQGGNKTKYIPERPNQDLVNENYWEVKPE